MSKWHTVTLDNLSTVYNDMFDRMDGVMRGLAKKKTQWKEDLFVAMKFTWQKLSKNYMEVTPTTCMLRISAHILDPLNTLRSFRKWDKGMDINPQVKPSYITQYQEAFLNYVENEYCAGHRRLKVTKLETIPDNNLGSSRMASRSSQSSYDPYDLTRDVEEYLMPNNVAETTPGQSDRAAHLLLTARLHLNSPPELPQNRGHINLNLHDYHSDPILISSTFWLPDITHWWRQQEEMHSKYADLCKVACDILLVILHDVRVEASLSLAQGVVRRRQSKTTGESLREKVVVRLFARANNRLLAGDVPELDPTSAENDMEMKREAKQTKLH